MAVAESEHNLRVPGTLKFDGARPSRRPARGHGRCGERTEPQGAWHPEVRGRPPEPPPRPGDMAVAESEHNLRVPGTLKFEGARPSRRPARGHGRCGERTQPQGAWHREVRGRL